MRNGNKQDFTCCKLISFLFFVLDVQFLIEICVCESGACDHIPVNFICFLIDLQKQLQVAWLQNVSRVVRKKYDVKLLLINDGLKKALVGPVSTRCVQQQDKGAFRYSPPPRWYDLFSDDRGESFLCHATLGRGIHSDSDVVFEMICPNARQKIRTIWVWRKQIFGYFFSHDEIA
jgi:hypothetical protein